MNNSSFKPQKLDFYVDFVNQFFKTLTIIPDFELIGFIDFA